MSWISDAWKWLWGKLKPIFTLTAEKVAKDAIDIINDPELQAAAREAVTAAAKSCLSDEDSWVTARDTFVAILKTKGRTLKDSAINLLIEAAYYCFKNRKQD